MFSWPVDVYFMPVSRLVLGTIHVETDVAAEPKGNNKIKVVM